MITNRITLQCDYCNHQEELKNHESIDNNKIAFQTSLCWIIGTNNQCFCSEKCVELATVKLLTAKPQFDPHDDFPLGKLCTEYITGRTARYLRQGKALAYKKNGLLEEVHASRRLPENNANGCPDPAPSLEDLELWEHAQSIPDIDTPFFPIWSALDACIKNHEVTAPIKTVTLLSVLETLNPDYLYSQHPIFTYRFAENLAIQVNKITKEIIALHIPTHYRNRYIGILNNLRLEGKKIYATRKCDTKVRYINDAAENFAYILQKIS